MNELFLLMRENPFGTLIIMLCVLWAVERMVVAFINRNKPIMSGGDVDTGECDEDED